MVRAARDADLGQQALGIDVRLPTGLFDRDRLFPACQVVRVCARLFSHQLRRPLHDRQPDLHRPAFGAQPLQVGVLRGDLAA